MVRIVRLGVLLLLGVGVVPGLLILAAPAHRAAGEGPADPALAVRRGVLDLLGRVGLYSPGFLLGPRPWLPSATRTETGKRGADGVLVRGLLETASFEPVYRGLLWRVGYRVTLERKVVGEGGAVGPLRLVYREGDRVVAGDDARPEPGGRRVLASGFVPAGAGGFWFESRTADGGHRLLVGWGEGPSE